MSPDTQAILLLCGRFGSSDTNLKPLTTREYNSIAQWLVRQNRRPADLLDRSWLNGATAPIPREHLDALLARGAALAVAMERWSRLGIWVVGRGDAAYPRRIKQKLASSAPPFFFGVGVQALLGQGGVAIVGARDADPETLAFVRDLARASSRDDLIVISGGARGVDQEAMLGATEAGGASVGVVSHGLAQAAVSGKYRAALSSGRLALLSAVAPAASFSTGNAMGRNRYIYALADAAVVALSGTEGGTWTGAKECIRRGWVPVYIRDVGDPGSGNRLLLQLQGRVRPFPAPAPASLRELIDNEHERADTAIPSPQLGLFSGDAPSGAREPPRSYERPARVSAEDLNKLFLQFLSDHLGDEGRGLDWIVEASGLQRSQVSVWLRKAVSEGTVTKTKNPVRYVVA